MPGLAHCVDALAGGSGGQPKNAPALVSNLASSFFEARSCRKSSGANVQIVKAATMGKGAPKQLQSLRSIMLIILQALTSCTYVSSTKKKVHLAINADFRVDHA